jgi:hypothetical protein
MKSNVSSLLIRTTLALLILASIGMMYYVNIVKRDFIVFTNADGPVVEEE